MIHPASIQEVLDRCQIEEVVRDFVSLKRNGANLIGLCPFHNEKTPSFSVSPTRNIFKCFGCGKGGDSLGFIMEHENLTFPDAVRFLAQKYRIQLDETTPTETQLEDQKQLDSLYLVNAFAAKFFEKELWESDRGKQIGLTYLKHREFREDTIRQFQIGFAPESGRGFTDEAIKEGYSLELLQQLGLTNSAGRDFFSGRIMFPISNMSGKIIAFAGRVLASNTKTPKYINSPETEIYQKSKTLFGMHLARRAIQKENECILTEGYTDVMALQQAGIAPCVASSGTSLTRDQIRMIKRLTDNVLLLFDGDAAGVNAALRGMGLTLEEDLNVRVVLLPEGDDPDSFLRKSGANGFQEYLRDHAASIVEFELRQLLQEAGNDPIRRSGVITQIAGTIGKVRSPIKREPLVKACKALLQVDEEVLNFEINRQLRKDLEKSAKAIDFYEPSTIQVPEGPSGSLTLGDSPQERDIARILLLAGNQWMNPEREIRVADFILQNVTDVLEVFDHPLYKEVLELFLERAQNGKDFPESTFFLNHPQQEIKDLAIGFVFSPYVFSDNWEKRWDIFLTQKHPDENFVDDARKSLARFRLRKITRLIEENSKALRELGETHVRFAEHIKLHIKLKQIQMQLAEQTGTVVLG